MILGIGNVLFTDEGFGIRVVEKLEQHYTLPENVTIVDGGVLGMNLLGVMSEADQLIVVDAVRNKQPAGTLYRLSGEEIPGRIRAKNSLHQVDFLEALTMCQALDHVPEAVIIGVEPKDIETLSTELTPEIRTRVDPALGMVLEELDRLGVSYKKEMKKNVSGNTI